MSAAATVMFAATMFQNSAVAFRTFIGDAAAVRSRHFGKPRLAGIVIARLAGISCQDMATSYIAIAEIAAYVFFVVEAPIARIIVFVSDL